MELAVVANCLATQFSSCTLQVTLVETKVACGHNTLTVLIHVFEYNNITVADHSLVIHRLSRGYLPTIDLLANNSYMKLTNLQLSLTLSLATENKNP